MKRVVRSKSGREIYGPKWQINNVNGDAPASMETTTIAGDVSGVAAPPAVTDTTAVDNEAQTQASEGRRGNRVSNSHDSMYGATLEGDWVAAELLLEGDPSLGWDEISEEGDRALHVAASMGHHEFVRKLVERMSPSELGMVDGRGYTACCYAAIAGSVEIAGLMIEKNPGLATVHDRENKTPLHKAAFRGKAKMVSYLLKSTKVEDLSTKEWFDDLLLATIRREMYGVALEISERDEQLSTMTNNEGTALHLLARQPFYLNDSQRIEGIMRPDMQLLAKNLWAGIQRLGQSNVVELMKNPSILHDAAEVGNVELITMLTHTYPHLIWHTNIKGYTIFHIAINCRHEPLFCLINEIGASKDFIAISQDENGNNILHLAAELPPPGSWWPLKMVVYQMQREMLWFEKVKAIVPPSCWEMRNKQGYTPSELFTERHKSLLEKSETWIRNASDSCMLIATLIFTVVFGSAFAVPGGYHQDTGIPILVRTNWFTCFVIFEALSLFSSALSIACFLNIMMLGVGKIHFATGWFVWGLNALTLSVFGAISTFVSAYFLVYTKVRAAGLVMFVLVLAYIVTISVVFSQLSNFIARLPQRFFLMEYKHTLFKRHG